MREYHIKRYYSLKLKAIELLGGKCFLCGSKDNLEFDHIDRKTKKFSISDFITYSKEKVQKELKKCQLLCNSCHKEKTRIELKGRTPWNKGKKFKPM